jgi:hypothetical protein
MLTALLLAAIPYLLVDGHNVTSSGFEQLSELRDAYGSHFFAFRYEGATYVVRDERALREIRAVFRRQREIGEEQGRIGSKQGEIGSEQGRVGSGQGALSSRVTWDAEARRRMRELDDEMRALDARMRPLNDQMRELNEQMREEERKVNRELRTLLPDLIRRGVAQEVER